MSKRAFLLLLLLLTVISGCSHADSGVMNFPVDKVPLFYRSYNYSYINSPVTPCDVQVWMHNQTGHEITELTIEFQLLDKAQQVIYSLPITFTNFAHPFINYKGPLVPNVMLLASARPLIPGDKIRSSTSYWMKVTSVRGLAELGDLHVPSHWFTALLSKPPQEISALIDKNPWLVNLRDPATGFQAIHMAALAGYAPMLSILMAKGADINSLTANGAKPIHIAAYASVDALAVLLAKGANANEPGPRHSTPLDYCMCHMYENKDYAAAVKLLLQHGANAETMDDLGLSPLARSLDLQNPTPVLKLLVDKGAQVNTIYQGMFSPLSSVAYSGHLDACEILLKAGANPNLQAPQSLATPLHEAARAGNLEIIKFLLKNGADPRLKDMDGHTPANWASATGQSEAAALLNEQLLH